MAQLTSPAPSTVQVQNSGKKVQSAAQEVQSVSPRAQVVRDVETLVDYALLCNLIQTGDKIWAFNSICSCIGEIEAAPEELWLTTTKQDAGANITTDTFPIEAHLTKLAQVAIANHKEEDTPSGRDRVAMNIIGMLMPRPSTVSDTFMQLMHSKGSAAACAYLYTLSCQTCYVRKEAIARNLAWTSTIDGNELEITINLSKPEKDPKAIAAAGSAPQGERYPACQLCIQNEGFAGRSGAAAGGAHPARNNLRIIPLTLGGERWGFQYSPYAYFSEHSIVMSASHRPMHIDTSAFSNLLEFVDTFDAYMIGSNADLPIVGGSILSHDHYQTGLHVFPLMKAPTRRCVALAGYNGVAAEELIWPLSTIRLTACSKDELIRAATHVLDTWKAYNDKEAGVVAYDSDGTRHNTITPIARKVPASSIRDEVAAICNTQHDAAAAQTVYELYLALRCNVTSKAHPLGVFHPHAEYHHIKKENIGLIEVMGLAILPARLKSELHDLCDVLETAQNEGLFNKAARESADADAQAQVAADTVYTRCTETPSCNLHAAWARDIATRIYHKRQSEHEAAYSRDELEALLREETSQVFWHVLENAGVFKLTDNGFAQFNAFVDAVNK